MTSLRSFIQRYSTVLYFVLTILISWGCMDLMIEQYSFPLTSEQSEAVGPLLYVGMLVGPSISGLLLIGLTEGKGGYRELFSRLTRWRVNTGWYLFTLLGTPFLATVVLLALSVISPEFTPAIITSEDRVGMATMGIGVGLMVAVFEEIGWTGFAVPQLRKRYGVTTTGIIVGVIWGLWHFPPFWGIDSFAGVLPLAVLTGQLFAWLPPFRVLMVYVHDETKSLLLTILMHASLVFTTLTLPPMGLTGVNLLIWLVVWGLTLWGVVKIIKLIKRGIIKED